MWTSTSPWSKFTIISQLKNAILKEREVLVIQVCNVLNAKIMDMGVLTYDNAEREFIKILINIYLKLKIIG